LHPAYKLQYFRDHAWAEDWIQTALQLVRDEWSENYRPEPIVTPPVQEPAAPVSNK
ncbi:hypothetical protein SISSUDRAFT_995367, partial [Sistotremastrum suecicum HHB10207 ss-3]